MAEIRMTADEPLPSHPSLSSQPSATAILVFVPQRRLTRHGAKRLFQDSVGLGPSTSAVAEMIDFSPLPKPYSISVQCKVGATKAGSSLSVGVCSKDGTKLLKWVVEIHLLESHLHSVLPG